MGKTVSIISVLLIMIGFASSAVGGEKAFAQGGYYDRSAVSQADTDDDTQRDLDTRRADCMLEAVRVRNEAIQSAYKKQYETMKETSGYGDDDNVTWDGIRDLFRRKDHDQNQGKNQNFSSRWSESEKTLQKELKDIQSKFADAKKQCNAS